MEVVDKPVILSEEELQAIRKKPGDSEFLSVFRLSLLIPSSSQRCELHSTNYAKDCRVERKTAPVDLCFWPCAQARQAAREIQLNSDHVLQYAQLVP